MKTQCTVENCYWSSRLHSGSDWNGITLELNNWLWQKYVLMPLKFLNLLSIWLLINLIQEFLICFQCKPYAHHTIKAPQYLHPYSYWLHALGALLLRLDLPFVSNSIQSANHHCLFETKSRPDPFTDLIGAVAWLSRHWSVDVHISSVFMYVLCPNSSISFIRFSGTHPLVQKSCWKHMPSKPLIHVSILGTLAIGH